VFVCRFSHPAAGALELARTPRRPHLRETDEPDTFASRSNRCSGLVRSLSIHYSQLGHSGVPAGVRQEWLEGTRERIDLVVVTHERKRAELVEEGPVPRRAAEL